MDREADSLGLGDKHPPARGSPQRRLYFRFPRPDGLNGAGNHLRVERVLQHEKSTPIEGIRLCLRDAPKWPPHRRPLKLAIIRMKLQTHGKRSRLCPDPAESRAQAPDCCPSAYFFCTPVASAMSSARSRTRTDSSSERDFTASSIIVMQNGHPTATHSGFASLS